MATMSMDIGIGLRDGRLSDATDGSRRMLFAQRASRLGGDVKTDPALLDHIEGLLVLRAGWAAPWLRDEERSALRDHLTRSVRGETLADEGAACVGPCPLCTTINDHSGYDTAARRPSAVRALAAGLVQHLVSSRSDAGYPTRVLALATPRVASQARARLVEALDLLDAYVSWWGALRESTARRLVLFESTNLFGFTSPLVPQTLFVNAGCDTLQFVERLVHEATHGQVYSAQDVLRFTEAPPTHLIASPLRADRRPVLGVFHATVVSTRVMVAMREIGAGAAGRSAEGARVTAARVSAAARAGIVELQANGHLTAVGEALVRLLDQEVSQ